MTNATRELKRLIEEFRRSAGEGGASKRLDTKNLVRGLASLVLQGFRAARRVPCEGEAEKAQGLADRRLCLLVPSGFSAASQRARWRLGRSEYDLACFEAEQAAQLAVKALLYRLTGSMPRLHSLGELLGILVRFLREAGAGEAAETVAGFASGNRRRLWLLEDAYYRGRYGYTEV
ncbi:HEPN domain-containing protein [Pyrodictium abyssi]